MKVKIDENHSIEVLNYKPIDKGALKGSFILVIEPIGLKIFDCKHFSKDGKEWFAFPQKEIKKPDQPKSEYFPLVNLVNKEYSEKIKTSVMECLKLIPNETFIF